MLHPFFAPRSAHRRAPGFPGVAGLACSAALALAGAGRPAAAQVSTTFSNVGGGAYYTGDTNSCAIALNNLSTATVPVNGTPTTYQFATYYNTAGHILIGRRAPGAATWQTVDSGLAVPTADLSDDHDVIALGVDGTGVMHVSWDMHNVSLNYALSNGSVMGPSFSSVSFAQQTASNAPSLFASSGATTNEVTDPVFRNIPGGTNLLFTYRNGGAGGGSGNGNQYFDVYNTASHTWTNSFAINGEQTSVNAYLNSPVYTSDNRLLVSWTWRATSNWQTNSNIMFAQTPDSGVTWYRQDGTTQYTLPIIQSGTPASSVAQVIKTIPQNSSFINQTSMTVDRGDNPFIATYFAPGWNTTTNSGNPNRQYMLVYYTGSQWKTSQISSRISDTAIDTSGNDVRDLGRPVALVDNQNRVLVVTRSEDTAMGSYNNPATRNNIVVYWNTVASLDSASPAPWQTITLDSANIGSWEPTYDSTLWAASNKLDLLYEPTGLTGQTSGAVQVLEWDEQAYFAGTPEPSSAAVLGAAGAAALLRRRRGPRPSHI